MAYTQRELLIMLCIKNKGDWSKIYNDIKDHTEFTEEEEKALTKKSAEITKVYPVFTLIDDKYPEWIKKLMKRPPFALVVEKSDEAPNLLEDIDWSTHPKLLICDSEDMTNYVCSKDPDILAIRWSGADTDNGVCIIAQKDKYINVITEFFETDASKPTDPDVKTTIGARLLDIASINTGACVLTSQEKETGTMDLVARGAPVLRHMSVPGKSGSDCNKYIKENHAQLVDCIEDIQKFFKKLETAPSAPDEVRE